MLSLRARLKNLEKLAERLPDCGEVAAVTWNEETIAKIRDHNIRLTTLDRKRYFRSNTGYNLTQIELEEERAITAEVSKLYESMGLPGSYGGQCSQDFDRIRSLLSKDRDPRCEPLSNDEKIQLRELEYRRYCLHDTAPEPAAHARYNELFWRRLQPRFVITNNEREEAERLHQRLNKRGQPDVLSPFGTDVFESSYALDSSSKFRFLSILVADPSVGPPFCFRRAGFQDVDYCSDPLATIDRLTHFNYELLAIRDDFTIPYGGKLLPFIRDKFTTLPIIKVTVDPELESEKQYLPRLFGAREAIAAITEALSSRPKP
jgi:hypothetical protein